MYIYIFVSSIFLAAIITKGCVNTFSKRELHTFTNKRLDFPNIHYLKKIQTLSYFSEEKNLDRLEKILDKSTGIFDKTIKLIETNEEINEQYYIAINLYKYYFPFEKEPIINTTFIINDKEIKSSLGQLNFFMWLFKNDFLLHLE
tara:strand:- start:702 stop:1136 length:435 start_codon:yes stop_codon:yes gene_type:complete